MAFLFGEYMTLRQAIQAKIDAATAEVAARSAEIVDGDANFGSWMDEEPEAFKAKIDAFQAEIARHIG